MVDQQSLSRIQSTVSLYGLRISRYVKNIKLFNNICHCFSSIEFGTSNCWIPTFHYRDLSIRLHRFLQRVEPEERELWLTNIIDHVLEQSSESPHVTLENLEKAIAECVRPETTLQHTETIFNVIDTFEIPKIIYDQGKKKFVIQKIAPDLYPEVIHKSEVFRHRLELLWHRTRRNEFFTTLKFGEPYALRFELTPIEYLLSESKTGNVYVMGLLSQLTEGQYYLEDTGGAIKVDLSKAISFLFMFVNNRICFLSI